MRALILTSAAFLCFSFARVAAASADEIMAMMQREAAGNKVARELPHLPRESQIQLLDSIAAKVGAIGRAETAIELPDRLTYVNNAAILLAQHGTDQQILAAFGNISGFQGMEGDAALALASCSDPKGIDTAESMAADRLSDLDNRDLTSLPQDEQEIMARKYLALSGIVHSLVRSANPGGIAAAERIREACASRLTSAVGGSARQGASNGTESPRLPWALGAVIGVAAIALVLILLKKRR